MRRQLTARTRRRRGGFTMIEVMVSLGIMTIGAMTMIALQQHTIRSSRRAREITTGMQIAQLWIERLKQDAHTWTAPATTDADAKAALDATLYLKQVLDAPDAFVSFPANPDNGVEG